MKVKVGGWKTKTAAAASILTGMASVATGVVQALDGNFDIAMATIKGGIATAAVGLGMLGIGHKVEKAKIEANK